MTHQEALERLAETERLLVEILRCYVRESYTQEDGNILSRVLQATLAYLDRYKDSPVELPDAVETDRLEQLFEMQSRLNDYTMRENGQPSLDEIKAGAGLTQQWLRYFTLAIQQECSELIDSTNWKWWRTKVDVYDPQNVCVELIDILHFWISACQVMGLAAEDVVRIYIEKNKVNVERQRSGYLVKDEDDCRHIQPPEVLETPTPVVEVAPGHFKHRRATERPGCIREALGERDIEEPNKRRRRGSDFDYEADCAEADAAERTDAKEEGKDE